MIDERTVERIKNAANIVDVISDFVSLRKNGINYKGLCPFHDDHTPSFVVSPTKGVYKCFSCGKAGDVVGFLMEHELMTYPEAIKWLGRKYHIEVNEKQISAQEKESINERESVYIVNDFANNYFQDMLKNSIEGQSIGMDYFTSRGIGKDIIEKFNLGYSPNKRDSLAVAAKEKGYKDYYLIKSGLCGKSKDGAIYDRFAGRVIFPWYGVSGKVIAFGGRVLDPRTKGLSQKYINSPDSEVYHKSHELYGIYQAKKTIAKENLVFLVEGYTDVISMHQCGIENVVANSGTALSSHQISLIHRFTNNVVMIYDGDKAGIQAAIRGIDMFLSEDMNVKVLLLPDGDDPDSFSRKHTAVEFHQYIKAHAQDFITFKTDVLLKGVKDSIEKSEAISSIVKSISVVKNPITRALYIKDCAIQTGIDEKNLIDAMNKFIRRACNDIAIKDEIGNAGNVQNKPKIESNTNQKTNHNKIDFLEKVLIKIVIRDGDKIISHDVEWSDGKKYDLSVAEYIYYDLEEDDLKFKNDLYDLILCKSVAFIQEGKKGLSNYLINYPNEEVKKMATITLGNFLQISKDVSFETSEKETFKQVSLALIDYRMAIVKERINKIDKEILNTGPIEKKTELMEDINTLSEISIGLRTYAINIMRS